jgi:hypothetical protein
LTRAFSGATRGDKSALREAGQLSERDIIAGLLRAGAGSSPRHDGEAPEMESDREAR